MTTTPPRTGAAGKTTPAALCISREELTTETQRTQRRQRREERRRIKKRKRKTD